MSEVKPKSPLAPLFQRGEQQRAESAFLFVNTLASPFEKGGLRGICSCTTLPPLNAVQAA